MMRASLVMLAAVAVASANDVKHPVRQEIVDEIKLKATSWTPKEVEDNHMRHRSVESIKSSMGHLGTSQTTIGADLFKSVTKGAMDVFRSISLVVGHKETSHRLK